MKKWVEKDQTRFELVQRLCPDVHCVANSVKEIHARSKARGENMPYAEIAANAALVLTGIARALWNRQRQAQATPFVEEGGFTERLYPVRSARRARSPN